MRLRALAAAVLAALLVLAGAFAIGSWRSLGPGRWREREVAPLPYARWGSAVAVAGGRLLVFGGWSGRDLRASLRADAYDPKADRWTPLHDLPAPFTHVVPVADGDTLWFLGGFLGDKDTALPVTAVWRYSVSADTWTPGPPLPEARAGGGAVMLGRTLHYYGGFGPDGRTASGRHWALPLDSSGTWRECAPMPSPRGHLSGIAVEGLAYAIGGENRHDDTDVGDVHVYDPARDAWRQLASLPSPRSHVEPSTFVHGGFIVIMGGRDNSTWQVARQLLVGDRRALAWDLPAKLWRIQNGQPRDGWAMTSVAAYDIARDRWIRLPRLPEALLAPTAKEIDGQVIVTGGSRLGWSHPQVTSYAGPLELPR